MTTNEILINAHNVRQAFMNKIDLYIDKIVNYAKINELYIKEIKKYTMFLIDERVHEEFHRITIQLNKEFKDVIKEIKS